MTSFQIAIKPSRRAAGRFVSRVRRTLQRALVEEGERSGINQSRVADAIGVHRSVISRELNGRQDITLGRVAELAWALGREIEFDLVAVEQPLGANMHFMAPAASMDFSYEMKMSDHPDYIVKNVSDNRNIVITNSAQNHLVAA